MKDCEIYSNLRVPCGSKIVIRIDGRNFSNLSHELKLEKPYDLDFVKIMSAACQDLFLEFSPKFIYTFSDEINILLEDIPFSGRLEKINSVFASFITGSFTRLLFLNDRFSKYLKDIAMKPVSFDSRIIPLNYSELIEYFKGRQDEAWRNCLNGYAYWTLRKDHDKMEAASILDKKKNQKLHDLLFERNINIMDVPAWQRRGVGIYRKKITVEGYNPIKDEKVSSIRWKPFTNWDLPLFNREFFSKQILKNE